MCNDKHENSLSLDYKIKKIHISRHNFKLNAKFNAQAYCCPSMKQLLLNSVRLTTNL